YLSMYVVCRCLSWRLKRKKLLFHEATPEADSSGYLLAVSLSILQPLRPFHTMKSLSSLWSGSSMASLEEGGHIVDLVRDEVGEATIITSVMLVSCLFSTRFYPPLYSSRRSI